MTSLAKEQWRRLQSAALDEPFQMGFRAIVIALATQSILVAYSFPVTELLSTTPLLFSDSGYHWYHMQLAVSLARDGTQWAYDPFFAAGQPRGVFLDPSANFPAALAALFAPAVSVEVLYKIHAFVSAVIAPLCVLAAARHLEMSRLEAIAAFVFGLLLFWVSLFRWFYTSGMISFVTAAYLALPFITLFVRYLSGAGGNTTLVGAGLFGALAFFYHPFFPLIVAAVIGPWLMLSWRRVDAGRTVAALTVIPLVSLVPNIPWLHAWHSYGQLFQLGDFIAAYQNRVDGIKIWREILGIWDGLAFGSKMYAPVLIFAVWAATRRGQGRQETLSIAFLLGGVLITLFSAFGASVGAFQSLQPNRFAPIGYLLLVMPAALGFSQVLLGLRASKLFVRAAAALTSLAVVVPISYSAFELVREVSYADVGHFGKRPPLVAGAGEYTRHLEDWIKTNTDGSSRIFFEVSKGRIYDGGRVTGYLAMQTKREFIGGPYPFLHFASFWDGWAFGQELATISPQQFSRYLSLYNIGSIIVHSDASKKYFDALPEAYAAGAYKEFKMYKIDQRPSFFLQGQGNVSVRVHNRIVVTDVSGPMVVLKYHYFERLTIQPHARLVPVKLPDDPVPFIGIESPPSTFTIAIR